MDRLIFWVIIGAAIIAMCGCAAPTAAVICDGHRPDLCFIVPTQQPRLAVDCMTDPTQGFCAH